MPCGISWLVTDQQIRFLPRGSQFCISLWQHQSSRAPATERSFLSPLSRPETHTQERKISSPYMERSASFRWINPSPWSHAGAIRQSPQRCVAEGECFWCAMPAGDIQPRHKRCQWVLKYQKRCKTSHLKVTGGNGPFYVCLMRRSFTPP